jgi:2-dehydropantoate 2-reductase
MSGRTNRRWVVLGAGAVGGAIGGRLYQSGADVVLIARGAHGAAIREHGLRLIDADGEALLPVPCVETPADLRWQGNEVVVLATKTQQATDALDALAAVAPDAPVVCATNGLEAERIALRRFAQVHAMVVMLPSAHMQPGVVEVASAPCSGILDLGLATGGYDEVDTDLAQALRASTFAAEPRADIIRPKRTKLLLNLANVIEAACGPDTAYGEVYRAARAEGAHVLDTAGLPYTSREEDRARRGDLIKVRPITGRHRTGGSTWQSLARGAGDSEVDYLNGEIVLLGRLHDVQTPVNAALQRLGRQLFRSGTEPGSMSADQLSAWIRADQDTGVRSRSGSR